MNPNALVGTVLAVTRGERGFSIELEGNRTARIDGERAAAQARAGLSTRS